MMSLAATIEPLRAANRAAGRELYRWRLCTPDGASPISSSGLPIIVDMRFSASDTRDILFVVAAFAAMRHGEAVRRELRRLARQRVLIGGVESGSWVLAASGLLDGHEATTHWEDLEDFGEAFPSVKVVDEYYVFDRLRCTSGGAAPTLDMILEILRLRHGLALAMEAARFFIYERRGAGRKPQRVILTGDLRATDPTLARAFERMATTITEPLSIEALAREAGLSVRNLQLRCQNALGMGPYEYYLHLRLSEARRMLEQTDASVATAAIACGFGSPSAFARAFRRHYGVNPSQTRKLRPLRF